MRTYYYAAPDATTTPHSQPPTTNDNCCHRHRSKAAADKCAAAHVTWTTYIKLRNGHAVKADRPRQLTSDARRTYIVRQSIPAGDYMLDDTSGTATGPAALEITAHPQTIERLRPRIAIAKSLEALEHRLRAEQVPHRRLT